MVLAAHRGLMAYPTPFGAIPAHAYSPPTLPAPAHARKHPRRGPSLDFERLKEEEGAQGEQRGGGEEEVGEGA